MAAEPRLTNPPREPRRLRTDVLLTLGGKLATLVLATASSVVVARALGPSGRGTFAVAYALTLMLVQFGTLGLVTANPYFGARDRGRVGRIAVNSLWLAGVLGALLIVVGAGLKAWLPASVAGVRWPELLIALAGIPALLSSSFLQSLLLGEGRMGAYNGVEVAQALVTFVGLVLTVELLGGGVGPALAVMVAGSYGACLAYLWLLRGHLSHSAAPDADLVREMLRYGFRVYVATVVAFLVIRVDLLLVNSYLGSEQAGFYSVVAALAEGMVLLPAVIGLNLFPRVARSGEGVELSAGVFRASAVVFGLLCLVSVPLAAPGIVVLFGPDFEAAVALYYWLVPGIFSLGMLTILSNHFAGRGFPLEAMLVWFAGLGLNVLINVAFLRHGTWVAPLASSVAYAVLLALHMRLFARDAGGYGSLLPRPRELRQMLGAALRGA